MKHNVWYKNEDEVVNAFRLAQIPLVFYTWYVSSIGHRLFI